MFEGAIIKDMIHYIYIYKHGPIAQKPTSKPSTPQTPPRRRDPFAWCPNHISLEHLVHS